MSNNIILFGASYGIEHWKEAFRQYNWSVTYCDLKPMHDVAIKWKDSRKELFISAETGNRLNPAGGIWRIGAVNPRSYFQHFLEILNAASDIFPMVNPASSHLTCSRRVRMLSLLSEIKGLPLVNFHAFVTGRYIVESSFKPEFPIVLKLGNYQGGLMKWKIESREQWLDFFDSFQALDMPVLIEEFVNFDTEFRCLFIGEDLYLIKRQDVKGWKAQHARKSEIIEMNEEIAEMTLKAKELFKLDIGALDIVESKEGLTIFEINDAPDINPQFIGIEDNTWKKVASILHEKTRK